ncbi:DUF2382 domain-containing protein [Peterkaempfera griseoplana]|uniref:DUF2382 domain-containing protein n=1 Tax=Peterkaempfera griseoplana TaxID=66896 RepID=UPI0006E1CC5B|nr:PRC and DUF2382 domain-containing protein [Peterkaempfera griseoplana]
MITRQQITTVLDHPVYDAHGNKIGEAKHVFLDDASGRPEWVSVRTGLFGTSESFVPIHDATLVEDHLQVAYPKEKIKDAPAVDVDAGGHLSESEEHRLYDYYGIDMDATWAEAQKSGDTGWASAGRSAAGTGTTGTGAGAGAAAAAGAATTGKARSGDLSGAAGRSGAAGVADTGYAAPGAKGMRRTGEREKATASRDAMTRSEERLRISTERYETGRARLRKYVVTEEQEMTVPVHHEEVRIEREPITDATRDAALSGPELTEDEYEVVLHGERAVASTETVPVERVRLLAEDHVEQETVKGRVRKERIEAETPKEGRRRLD